MSRFLDEFVKVTQEQGNNIFRVSEIHNGKTETRELKPCNPCQNCYSIAKAFTMTAIGMLWDKGLIDLEEKAVDIFADILPEGMDEKWNKTTVDMLLTHRCGMPCGYLDIDRIDIHEYIGDDFLKYMFLTAPINEPGSEFVYSDAAFYMLSRIFSAKSGEMMDEYLWRELFWPLGFQEAAWSKCPQGYPMGATGLYARSEHVARLGQLYLDRGVYNGQRLLSEAWVDLALGRKYELGPTGYSDAYCKGGMNGQELIVIPSENRVVCWHAYEYHDFPINLVEWVSNYKD